ncbi:ABC transporter substrate-binding protein [Oceaniglobus roseus]|uniref:ABC transporter substrate-binding protein n=1 Tax=Oceaniglobus roseus TaxID=1737570 RepID=UPI000C7F6839|nr:ABC transporter substrate-binding protein [Kandeliimicrobium roseum]
MRRFVRPLLLTPICAAALATAASAQTVNLRLGEDPESLYNVQTNSLTANSVINYVVERLVYIDLDGTPKPWLASGWEVSDDQTRITFTLRDGLTFTDGTPFNADAVVAQFNTILDPDTASPQLATQGPLKSVEAKDDKTVVFTYSEPFAPAFNALSGVGAGINSPTAVEKAGDDYARAPVGTGPFTVEQWIPGTSITLARNDAYHEQYRDDVENPGPAHIEGIVLNVIPEEGVAQAALETGELSAASLQADAIGQFVDNPDFKTIIDKSSGNLVFLEFNMQQKPFDDVTVRKAIGYAINREAAVAAAWNGYGQPAYSLLSAAIPGYDPEVAKEYGTPYDPEKAKALFAEAGWTDSDGDGTLDKDGTPAEWTILSYAGFTHIDRTLQVIQANLADIGIKIDLQTSDWGAFYPSLLEDGWDMDLMRWTWSDADVLNQIFQGDGHRDKTIPNEAVDSVLKRCSTTMEPEARLDCISEAQKVLLENMVAVPVLTNWGVYATQANIEGYKLDHSGYLLATDLKVE